MQAGPTLARDRAAPAAPRRAPVLQTRFAAIWVALLVLLIVGRIGLPRSVEPSTILAILPFAAFLTMAAMGQALVMMGRGIDLSVPAIISPQLPDNENGRFLGFFLDELARQL